MKSDIDEVALQGIEFWSNVCDEEVDLAIEASEAAELGRPPERTSRFYAKGALQVNYRSNAMFSNAIHHSVCLELVLSSGRWISCNSSSFNVHAFI